MLKIPSNPQVALKTRDIPTLTNSHLLLNNNGYNPPSPPEFSHHIVNSGVPASFAVPVTEAVTIFAVQIAAPEEKNSIGFQEQAMTTDLTPTVRVYIRERGGKRSFHPAPENPDLAACYWLRYEKDGKQTWQRVGHYDLLAREQLLLERSLSAQAQGFIIPEDQAAEKASGSRVRVRAAVDAYLESLRIQNRPKKTIGSKTYELGLFTGFCKKTYMDELVSADILGFRDYLRSEDYAERTVYNYLMTTTTFLEKNGLYRIVGLLEVEDWPEVPPPSPSRTLRTRCGRCWQSQLGANGSSADSS
jgi:hypothetical protein